MSASGLLKGAMVLDELVVGLSVPRDPQRRITTLLRSWNGIRRMNFSILAAVAELIPSSGDVEGRACGVLRVAEIADRLNVSHAQVRKTLAFFRAWRVIWMQWHGKAGIEFRFERRIVVGLLAAQKACPRDVKRFMRAHREKRERVAPYQKREAASPLAESGVLAKHSENLNRA